MKARLTKVTFLGLLGVSSLLGARRYLDRGVAIGIGLLNLGNNVLADAQHRRRVRSTGLVVDLGHAVFGT